MSYYKSGDEVRAAEAILRALKKQSEAMMLQLAANKDISDLTLHNLRIATNSLGTIALGSSPNSPTLTDLDEIGEDIERLRIMAMLHRPPRVIEYEAMELEIKIGKLAIRSDRVPLKEKVQLDLPPYDEEEETTEEVDTSFIGKLKAKVKGK